MNADPSAPRVPRTGAFAPHTVVVTGATSGIGLATARALRSRTQTLVLVGRNPEKLAAARQAVSALPGAGAVETHLADLSVLSQVRRLAGELAQSYPSIDVLVNNAGAYYTRFARTPEGIEQTLALNVLTPYLLTRLLHDPLRAAAPSRVVNVASAAHRGVKLHLEDFERNQVQFSGFRVYGRSKLELILLTHEFARRWAADRISVNALHPGFVRSGFARNNGGAVAVAVRLLALVAGVSPEKGATTPVYLASSPQVEGTTGEYFVRGRAVHSSRESYDEPGARRLWEACAERVGLPADG